MSDLLHKALSFATKAHQGQDRKYTGLPYIVHPIEVMNLVSSTKDATDQMLAAALLHDVLEDTEVQLSELLMEFGAVVTYLVRYLTDEFTKEAYPSWNREKRKEWEAARLASIPPEAQTIKVADMISNTRSIVAHDPSFAKIYLQEKRDVLKSMRHADPGLHARAFSMLRAQNSL